MDKEIKKSALGTPIFDDLKLSMDSHIDNSGNQIRYQIITLDNVLISVSQSNKIVRTDISGRDGSVFEFIGRDDRRISINGILVGNNMERPEDQLSELEDILNSVIPIQVTCKYLNQLGITDLIIESSELPQQEGGYAYQQFSINCYEFIPQELRLTGV
jgi:hypothetical protein